MEQTGVTDHAVVEQFLITGSRLPISELIVIKLQTNRPRANGRTRNFGAYLEGNSFLGLDVENHVIRCNRIRFVDGKKRQRRRLKSNDDAGGPLRHSLP